ncbi:hypothetical protein CC1G_13884 [Coprinopsis cinerea okayama7|uniref:Uncharacterized protein n=1 Tax=Coprinopsis cinerea (strain Okayama-7 / 130 / ATCC MYA-4618 / FGSC 9003) TaxID=240176 RepID=D6RKM2_COPC7|nr:hypothetical protein CC1G_13884 [Coprinopsis cinerea okayama7\|eukprot:XP_002911848.1 hypothetical protein CC1G_13884 [Coprinopsis cinerea okayama7\
MAKEKVVKNTRNANKGHAKGKSVDSVNDLLGIVDDTNEMYISLSPRTVTSNLQLDANDPS